MNIHKILLGGVISALLLNLSPAGAVSATATITVKDPTPTFSGTCLVALDFQTSGETNYDFCNVTVTNATPGATCTGTWANNHGNISLTISSSGTGWDFEPWEGASGKCPHTITCNGVTVNCTCTSSGCF